MKINGRDVADGTIGPKQVADGAVTERHISSGSVGRRALQRGVVGPDQLESQVEARLLPSASPGRSDYRAALVGSPSPPNAQNPFVTLNEIGGLKASYWGEPAKGSPLAQGAEPVGMVRIDRTTGTLHYIPSRGSEFLPVSFSHAGAMDLEADPQHRHVTAEDLATLSGFRTSVESGSLRIVSALATEDASAVRSAIALSPLTSPIVALSTALDETHQITMVRGSRRGHAGPTSVSRSMTSAEETSYDSTSDGLFDIPFRVEVTPSGTSISHANLRGASAILDSGVDPTPRADKIFLGESAEDASGYLSLDPNGTFINSMDTARIGDGGYREGNVLVRGSYVASGSGEGAQVIGMEFPRSTADDEVTWITDRAIDPTGSSRHPARVGALSNARTSPRGLELARADRWERKDSVSHGLPSLDRTWAFVDGPRTWIAALGAGSIRLFVASGAGTSEVLISTALSASGSSGLPLESSEWSLLDCALVTSVPGVDETVMLALVFFGSDSDGRSGFFVSSGWDPVIGPSDLTAMTFYDCSRQLRLAYQQVSGRDLTSAQDVALKCCGRQRRNASGGPAHVGLAFMHRSRLFVGAFDWLESDSAVEPYFAVVQAVSQVSRFSIDGLDDNGMAIAAEILPHGSTIVGFAEFGGIRSTLAVQSPTWAAEAVRTEGEQPDQFVIAVHQPWRALSDAAAQSVLDGGRFVHLLSLSRTGILKDTVWTATTSGGSPSSPPVFELFRDSDVAHGVSAILSVASGKILQASILGTDGRGFIMRTDWQTQQDPIVNPSKDAGSAFLDLTGTVAVTAADETVTGTSTLFTTELEPGDRIRIGDYTVAVAGIASATSLEMVAPWPGSNGTGIDPYKVDLGASSWDSERIWVGQSAPLCITQPDLLWGTDPSSDPTYPSPAPVGKGLLGSTAVSQTFDGELEVWKIRDVAATAAACSQFLSFDAPSDLDETAFYGCAGNVILKHSGDAQIMVLIGGAIPADSGFSPSDSVAWLALDDSSDDTAAAVQPTYHYQVTSTAGGLPVPVSHASTCIARGDETGFIAFVAGGLLKGRPYADPDPAHYVQRLILYTTATDAPTGSNVDLVMSTAEASYTSPTIQGGWGTLCFLSYSQGGGTWYLNIITGNGDLYRSVVDLDLKTSGSDVVPNDDTTAWTDAFAPVGMSVEATEDGIALSSSVVSARCAVQWSLDDPTGLVIMPDGAGSDAEKPVKTWAVFLENDSSTDGTTVKVLRVDEDESPQRKWFASSTSHQDPYRVPKARLEAQVAAIGWKDPLDEDATTSAAVLIFHGGTTGCSDDTSQRCSTSDVWFLEIWEATSDSGLVMKHRWTEVPTGMGLTDPGPAISAACFGAPRQLDSGDSSEDISYCCWGGALHPTYSKGHSAHAWVYRWPDAINDSGLDVDIDALAYSGPYITGLSSVCALGPIPCESWGKVRIRVRGQVPTGTSVEWVVGTSPTSDVWKRYDSVSGDWLTTTSGGATGIKLQNLHQTEDSVINAWTTGTLADMLSVSSASQLWIGLALRTTVPYLTPVVEGIDVEFLAENDSVMRSLAADEAIVWRTVSGDGVAIETEDGSSQIRVALSTITSR